VPDHPRRETPLPQIKPQAAIVLVVVALSAAALLIPWIAVKLAVLTVIGVAFLITVVMQG
jgi:hypothetical protein